MSAAPGTLLMNQIAVRVLLDDLIVVTTLPWNLDRSDLLDFRLLNDDFLLIFGCEGWSGRSTHIRSHGTCRTDVLRRTSSCARDRIRMRCAAADGVFGYHPHPLRLKVGVEMRLEGSEALSPRTLLLHNEIRYIRPAMSSLLRTHYPWTKAPFLASAPMLGAATPALAASVSKAGGIGFLAGSANSDTLDKDLQQVASILAQDRTAEANNPDILPIGLGFQLWGAKLSVAVSAVKKHLPAVVWLFAPSDERQLQEWSRELRLASQEKTKIWIQVGTVHDAKQAVELAAPDVLVLQGSDAGGHGLKRSASTVTLVPEVVDYLASKHGASIPVLAAGGIMDGRGVAGAIALGAAGAVMGTRFLAATEAGIAKGWQKELLKATDGGVSTGRSTLPDRLKETIGWPEHFDGRALLNKGHEDEQAGLSDAENIALYKQEMAQGDDAWGVHGRMVTYAGTGVGLVKEIKPAAEIVREVHMSARSAIQNAAESLRHSEPHSKL
ncbi:hypothetical protein LTR27_004796 [Elasticomyces elasticus]|nr:hypothetical protein LTR27_004796 [Elasticomyces elasticus]